MKGKLASGQIRCDCVVNQKENGGAGQRDSALWPIHLKPKPDELLSSWIVRLARAHGMKVQTYCQAVFGREQAIWNRDIDKSAPEALLHRMCELTGATEEQAYQITLCSFEGVVYEHHNPCAHTKWLLGRVRIFV